MSHIYEHSHLIENRLNTTLELISSGKLNAEHLAIELGVSKPTVHRIIAALKRRGHRISPISKKGYRSYMLSQK